MTLAFATRDFHWLDPWHRVEPGFEVELNREVGAGHPLAGKSAVAVARRPDTDDVLFFLPDAAPPFAVVHLTWSGRQEDRPGWPRVQFYGSMEEFAAERMRPDHQEFNGGIGTE